MDEAERCSRVGFLGDGRLLAADTPANIKLLMRGTVLEIVCPEIRRAFAVLKTLTGVREVQLFGDRLNVVVDEPEKQIPRVESALTREGIPVLQKRLLPPSLENVFISVTESQTSEAGHA
jgi:ABC-2 type transport system ATP-binding protein